MLTSFANWLFPEPEPTLREMLAREAAERPVRKTLGQLISDFQQLLTERDDTVALVTAIGESLSAAEIEDLSNTLGRMAHQMQRRNTPHALFGVSNG